MSNIIKNDNQNDLNNKINNNEKINIEILDDNEIILEDKEQINKYTKKKALFEDNKKIEYLFLCAFCILIIHDIVSIKNDYFKIKNVTKVGIINKIKQKGGMVGKLVNAYSMMSGNSQSGERNLVMKTIKYIGYFFGFFGFLIAAGLPLTVMTLLIVITVKYAKKQFIHLISTLQ
jgi:hypothetical protein